MIHVSYHTNIIDVTYYCVLTVNTWGLTAYVFTGGMLNRKHLYTTHTNKIFKHRVRVLTHHSIQALLRLRLIIQTLLLGSYMRKSAWSKGRVNIGAQGEQRMISIKTRLTASSTTSQCWTNSSLADFHPLAHLKSTTFRYHQRLIDNSLRVNLGPLWHHPVQPSVTPLTPSCAAICDPTDTILCSHQWPHWHHPVHPSVTPLSHWHYPVQLSVTPLTPYCATICDHERTGVHSVSI